MSDANVRLLYVDDDGAFVRLIQRTLARRGFEVLHATNSDEALSHIDEGSIDVVALDHYLATGTGLDFLAKLSLQDNPPAVVYVTGSAEMDIAVAALKAGATDFVPKTVGDDFFILLVKALDQAVEKSRLHSAKEAAEREVREARDRAELLLREMSHRVANSLSLVSSLVTLQTNAVADQTAKDALAETQSRIYAISLVHKSLYTSGDVRFVAIDEYLDGLLGHLRALMSGEGYGATLTTDLEELKVSPDTAVNLGVIVTELVTNAFKYAYPPGQQAGEIRVNLKRQPDGLAELKVCDDGIGWAGTGSAKGTGLGSRIISAMSKSLGAKLDYMKQSPGTCAKLIFALPPNS